MTDQNGLSVFVEPTEPPSPTEPIPSLADRTTDRTGAGGHAGQGVAAGRPELGRSPRPSPAHSMMTASAQL